jgi:hypothetical protein
MYLTHTPPIQITTGSRHHAFTSCAFWRGTLYVAYRSAPTHHPFPPGQIVIRQSTDGTNFDTRCTTTIHLPGLDADLRDPRLIATDDALYCLVGAYLPAYPRTAVSMRASENIIQSFLTYTDDGHTWAPLQPIYRPNYWIWSVLPLDHYFVAAAYHTGAPGEPSSIHLLAGESLLHLRPNGVIYDGACLERDATRPDIPYLYAHSTVAEPVLYRPTHETLGCLVRSEDGDKMMLIGVSQYPYQDWRWWNARQMIHPSAIISTPHGVLLAGRELVKGKEWNIYTSLYQLNGQHLTRLVRLPSANDTGYAGLCHGLHPHEFLFSYYSQHTTPTPYRIPLPGAHVFVGTITISP